jgi:hypothetical protein
MAKGWTPERKAAQRAAIYRWRPWEKSTGPKTPHGKGIVSRNAWKGGHRSRVLEGELRALREIIEQMGA